MVLKRFLIQKDNAKNVIISAALKQVPVLLSIISKAAQKIFLLKDTIIYMKNKHEPKKRNWHDKQVQDNFEMPFVNLVIKGLCWKKKIY